MTEDLDIQIRQLAREEIEPVEQHLIDGPPEKHRQRFVQQEQGRLIYLIAWHQDQPIGNALLHWGGTRDEPMASTLQDCPDIEDLYVKASYRSHGIGSQLLDIAEQLAHVAGYSHIGLGVGIDNQSARELYESRGYRYAGLGEYIIGGRYIDRSGRERFWKETCIYLIKQLNAGQAVMSAQHQPQDGQKVVGADL